MKNIAKLAVLGSINVDHIINLGQFPQPGETVAGQSYQVSFGGKGANQAVAAGRSGAEITFIACLGDDDLGERVVTQLAGDNINTAGIKHIDKTTTGVALIFVNGAGENEIAIYAGANAALTPAFVNSQSAVITEASILLMQLESPLESVFAAAKIAHQCNTRVVLNPAPACTLPDELFPFVSIITPNETEAEKLTGVPIYNDADAAKASAILHDKGVEVVIITLGHRGVWLSQMSKGIGQILQAFKVDAVDTIAAGDTFNGALVTALLENKPLDEAVRFANAAAAIAVTRKGAQPSVPWRDEIETFLQQQSL